MMKKIRGVWLTTAASNVFDTVDNIKKAMQLVAEAGFNTVFPVVWNNGYTLYPSAVLKKNFGIEISPPYTGRDILAEVIEEATKEKLEVIPWFEYGFIAAYKQDGGHIIKEKPEWAGKDKDNELLTKNDFVWMNSLDPEVQDFLLSLFLEVAINYKIAGVQADDHLPAMPSEGGYDRKTKELYYSQFGEDPPLDFKTSSWLEWRANILSDFLARLYREVKNINPNLIVSVSPSPYPFGFNEYLQDVPTWINRGIVDLIHPQLYRRDKDEYKGLVDDLVNQFGQKNLSKISPGVLIRSGDYQITPDTLWQSIRHNRRSGIRGEVLFFFEGLNADNQALATFLKDNNYANLVYLQYGNIGSDVEEIQQKLKNKGYGVGKTDGNFGSLTKSAVEKFQRDNSLSPDGVVGPETYTKLMN
ncbi:MAG: family 10 glycosylhydrolase [Nostoc sp.]|uniref:family 10 glycosylhydrolase n=1 Tax=Nostoc sp. TaxID=1180 RepID=UPI002FFC7A7C